MKKKKIAASTHCIGKCKSPLKANIVQYIFFLLCFLVLYLVFCGKAPRKVRLRASDLTLWSDSVSWSL